MRMVSRINLLAFSILALSGGARTLWAQVPDGVAVEPEAAPAKNQDTSVNIKFDAEREPEAEREGVLAYAPPIEQLFQNPAIASGLASSADAINRSVESLMDSLFYSILDNEKNLHITDEAWFSTSLKRDVYSTPSGSYVVMDRFQLGPRYAKELWRIHDIPISLGIDGTVEVMQVYLRTDGMRLAEQQELSPLRRWVNNWFGLLPLAATVLPPSFNQNELYDPVTQLKTPFSFPLDLEGFQTMPVGSIRSYAISGGIQVAADIAGAQGVSTRDALDKAFGMTLTMPYAIFKRGEHRINVLRRGEYSAWVGVKDLNRLGHSLSPLAGTTYHVFHGALAARLFDWDWVWKGVPLAVLPMDMSYEQAVADLFDQVYEYDLQNPSALDAYEAAVKGDFVPSRLRYLDAKEKGLDTGVAFHFSRIQDRNENVSRNGPNVAVYKRERARDHSESEIEITDPDGKFYVLESALGIEDKTWDVLVGEEQGRVQHTLEMKVRRVMEKPEAEGENALQKDLANVTDEPYSYAFEADPDPYRLTIGLNIQDRYVDVVEYYSYVDDLRFFSGLDLQNVPALKLRDPAEQEARRRSVYFSEPTDFVKEVHVTATYLGRFGAQATMTFSTEELDRILATPEDEVWAAFARAFGMDEKVWRDPAERASYGYQMRWFGAFFLYPTRLLNVRIAPADAIKEATNAVKQLAAIKQATTPLEKLDGFQKLLDTDHPRHLARALLELSDKEKVPRRVSFSAQPKGSARHEVKTEYGRLNNMIFRAGPPFPEPGRYARAQAKLANFFLDQPLQAQARPHISGIEVKTRTVPASVRSLEDDPSVGGELNRDTKHVFLEVTANGLDAAGPAKVYVRVEQAGRIKIGKLELAEKVLDLTPADLRSSDGEDQRYQFYLTGPLSPLSNFMLNQAVGSGDEFLVTLAVSREGAIWSDERAVEFRFHRGQLTPPK